MMISSGRGGIAATWTGAFPMFLKAAEQDHADAQFMVGWMYHNGIGIEPDAQKAADWYRRATSRFLNQKAQYNLRVLIEEGQVAWQEGDPGVPPLTVRKAEQ
jgi:TPR repeat protein